jgi:hypothetical protein
MNSKSLVLGVLMLALFTLWGFSASAFGATIYAKSVSYADVSLAVSQAGSGDTVIIPAGSATWDSQLKIEKVIMLQGAGVGNTVITASTGSTWVIHFNLGSVAANNEIFGMNNFTLNLNKASKGFRISNSSLTHKLTKFKIYEMYFKDCGGTSYVTAQIDSGFINGVIYSNTFDGYTHIDNYGYNRNTWDNTTFTYGSSDNIFYEDNIFELTHTTTAAFFSGGAGGRYCARYNTLTSNRYLSPTFDAHGNQGTGQNWSTMGIEIYGNKITLTGNHGSLLADHRGGDGIIFFNKTFSTSSAGRIQIREEYPDSLNPCNDCTQMINNSYYWNNRRSSDGELVGVTIYRGQGPQDECHPYTNVDFWQDRRATVTDDWNNDQYGCSAINAQSPGTFDGRSGVGCGTLANRPTTCTAGVVYWATNQSCDDVSENHIGANPTTPISGTLYKCVSTNTWAAFYTPYTYPHPLRGENDEVKEGSRSPSVPESPGGLTIIQ